MNTINLPIFSTEEEKKRMRVDKLSFDFAKRIVFLRKYLTTSVDDKEYVISKQLLRSGTSIGANIAEAEHPQSNADYLNKVSIALKEANETKFWIRLLKECGYITSEEESYLLNDCCTIIKILVSIVNKVSKRLNK